MLYYGHEYYQEGRVIYIVLILRCRTVPSAVRCKSALYALNVSCCSSLIITIVVCIQTILVYRMCLVLKSRGEHRKQHSFIVDSGRGLKSGKFMTICVLFMGYDYEQKKRLYICSPNVCNSMEPR